MKRRIFVSLMVLLAAAFIVLPACDSGGGGGGGTTSATPPPSAPPNPMAGVWTIYAKSGAAPNAIGWFLTLNADGTGNYFGGAVGTWKYEGAVLTFKITNGSTILHTVAWETEKKIQLHLSSTIWYKLSKP